MSGELLPPADKPHLWKGRMANQSAPPSKPKRKKEYENTNLSILKGDQLRAVELVLSIKWSACSDCDHAIWWHNTNPLVPGICKAHTWDYSESPKRVAQCNCGGYSPRS